MKSLSLPRVLNSKEYGQVFVVMERLVGRVAWLFRPEGPLSSTESVRNLVSIDSQSLQVLSLHAVLIMITSHSLSGF